MRPSTLFKAVRVHHMKNSNSPRDILANVRLTLQGLDPTEDFNSLQSCFDSIGAQFVLQNQLRVACSGKPECNPHSATAQTAAHEISAQCGIPC